MVSHKEYNIQEGYKAHNRTLLLMNYDLSKTYNENLVFEQNGFIDFMKRISPKGMENYSQGSAVGVGEWMRTWNHHDWLTAIEIITGIAGSIPSPIAPLLLGASVAAGLANGISYIDEGEEYLGGFFIALSVIPGHQLLTTLRGSKTFTKYGVEATKKMVESVASGTAKSSEREAVKQILKEAAPVAGQLAKLTAQQIVLNSLKYLATKSIKAVLATVITALRLGTGLTKVGIQIGGIYVTYDELYLFFNSENDRKLAIRANNELAQLKDYLLSNPEEVKQKVIDQVRSDSPYIEQNAGKFVSVQNTETVKQEELEMIRKEQQKRINQKRAQEAAKIVTYSDVLSGKEVFQYGMKSDGIKKVQKMLFDLNYDTELSDFGNNPKPIDGVFGKGTYYAVKAFQEDNKLTPTGIVDNLTLRKIESK